MKIFSKLLHFTIAVLTTAFLFSLYLAAYAEPAETPPDNEIQSTAENPFTPAGSGTTLNNAVNSDGKEFYTITTPDNNIFYLIIDKERETENVYFLNAVTIEDLTALADAPKKNGVSSPTPAPSPAPETPPSPTGDRNNNGTLIFILVIAVAGGIFALYFKIYLPKKRGAAIAEYEPPADETDGGAWDAPTENWDETDTEQDEGDGAI
jgi:hypothetical protein